MEAVSSGGSVGCVLRGAGVSHPVPHPTVIEDRAAALVAVGERVAAVATRGVQAAETQARAVEAAGLVERRKGVEQSVEPGSFAARGGDDEQKREEREKRAHILSLTGNAALAYHLPVSGPQSVSAPKTDRVPCGIRAPPRQEDTAFSVTSRHLHGAPGFR